MAETQTLELSGTVGPFQDGGYYSLRCLNGGGDSTYLDGRTEDGSVGLAPDPYHFSGAKWRASTRAGGYVLLECQGPVAQEKGLIYLDGHTTDHKVDLAPSAGSGHSGTLWEVINPEAENVMLRCMDNENPNLFLNTMPEGGKAALSDMPVKWEVRPI